MCRTPPSRRPTTCWCPPKSPTSISSGHTASSTVSSTRNRSRSWNKSSPPNVCHQQKTSGSNAAPVKPPPPPPLPPPPGGEKSVEAAGKPVLEVIDDVESRH